MNPQVDSALRRKTIVYIIIGILLVIILAVYVYITISQSSVAAPEQAPVAVSTGVPAAMTQQEASVRVAQIDQLTSAHPVLSPAEAASKASALAQLEAK